MTINPLRINDRNQIPAAPGAVVYWMSRDQRVADNWALLHARGHNSQSILGKQVGKIHGW